MMMYLQKCKAFDLVFAVEIHRSDRQLLCINRLEETPLANHLP
jgi:hypothetical protein